MPWRPTGNKPLSEPIMAQVGDAYVSLGLNEWRLRSQIDTPPPPPPPPKKKKKKNAHQVLPIIWGYVWLAYFEHLRASWSVLKTLYAVSLIWISFVCWPMKHEPHLSLQQCATLGRGKVRLGMQHTSCLRGVQDIETELREGSHTLQNLEVSCWSQLLV